MLDKLNQLSSSSGPLKPGRGMVSGVIALGLAILCFLGVLAFHFPEYLTTPQLRKAYDVELMRRLLYWSLVLSGALASGVCYAIWYSALRGLTAVQAGTVQLSVPILAALGGSLLLAEPFTPRLALVSVAVLGGVALVLRARAAKR